MSQNDLVIANQNFPATRADINSALQALGSTNSGSTAPATTYANMLWYDTSNNILKIRTEANDAWISIGYLNQGTDTFSLLDDTQTVSTLGVQTGLLGDQATTTWEGGTGTLQSLVSPANVKAAVEANVSNSPAYEAEVSYAGAATVAHGLGRVPTSYQIVLRCKVANLGYSVGDETDITTQVDGDGSRTYTTYVGLSDMTVRRDTTNMINTVPNWAAPTVSSWRYVFKAW